MKIYNWKGAPEKKHNRWKIEFKIVLWPEMKSHILELIIYDTKYIIPRGILLNWKFFFFNNLLKRGWILDFITLQFDSSILKYILLYSALYVEFPTEIQMKRLNMGHARRCMEILLFNSSEYFEQKMREEASPGRAYHIEIWLAENLMTVWEWSFRFNLQFDFKNTMNDDNLELAGRTDGNIGLKICYSTKWGV